MLSRREFGKLALAGVPAAAVLGGSDFFTAFAQGKPNSKIEGVQIGTITYSYRSMPDQSAEATLKYIVDSGISAVELMGGPVESYAAHPTAAVARRRWPRGRRRGAPGGGRGERGGATGGTAAGAPTGRGTAGVNAVIPAPGARWRRAARRRRRPRPRRGDARTAGGAAGTGRQGEGVAHQRLDGPLQEAAQDVQRRRRDHLRREEAQRQHVGRGVRVHVQRRRGARRARTRPSSCRPTTRS